MEETFELHFSPPSRKAPGFMRRLRVLVKFAQKSANNDVSAEDIDEMAKFLAQYVTNEGLTFEEKVDLIWDINQEQFDLLMSMVQAGSDVEDESEDSKN